MPISQTKYVDIKSGAGGQAAAANKELILRVFSRNIAIEPQKVLEFESSAAALAFFGEDSQEGKLSQAYFSYLSRRNTTPKKISFYRDERAGGESFSWSSVLTASPEHPGDIKQLEGVTQGSFSLTIGDSTINFNGLDFSQINSLSDAALIIENAVRAGWPEGSVKNNARCFIRTIEGQSGEYFNIESGDVGSPSAITVFNDTNASEGTYIGSLLGLDASQNPIFTPGGSSSAEGKTAFELLEESYSLNNNFGSFKFLDESDAADMIKAAQWCHDKNVRNMFILTCTQENHANLQEQTKDYNGTALIYVADTNDLAWVLPAAVMASTDYNRVNASPNFMYKQMAGLTPAVTSDALYKTLSPLKINFYGATQQTGAEIAFFQPGMLQGSITDMGVYAGEVWLKDALAVTFLNHQLSVGKWPANTSGEATGEALAQSVIEQALNNGVISPGKNLTNTQKAYIASVTGLEEGWRTLQDKGYIFSGEMVSNTVNGAEVWTYEYTLLYSKGDSVRKVEGTHTLI